ncbi:monofunctional biosynthetic peptidoglycan transglycosylase [Otariodibacter oris]|uniref:Biosynthetic peptidoglycan transglycosylase n=1 Tax=Otariodibacter oris TaxID=1032623 RepID=A0A420XIC6_9PAST|nr:monofunctional biosynthetic peptidoglycan transglycosylase [Otariodibacter oris]QGM80832.1 monofunctional biosynthetic peptidoglycan transglycosylase [Otariodibacter oris]RKR76996.1 monofunctional biosynthetic peptidoglycan transglycosylase [Otariodibacter oris]
MVKVSFSLTKWCLRKYFIPSSKIKTIKGWLWFFISRIVVLFSSFYFLLTLLFSLVPIPFSAYMLEKQIEHIGSSDYQQNYEWVRADKIAWQMKMAAIAGEDQKFDQHYGVDWDSIKSVVTGSIFGDAKLRGASTISQQTVKNLYLWHGTSWIRKGIELPLTLLIETLWSKERILEVYLNIAEFGEGIFGVEAAAKHYFHKSASSLNLSEASLLAASLPNPLIFKVSNPNAQMRKKQQWIISQIRNLGGRQYLEKL